MPTRCSRRLAARTQTACAGTLVTGVTYRNPAQLAKADDCPGRHQRRPGAARHRGRLVRRWRTRRSASGSRRCRERHAMPATPSRSARRCSATSSRTYTGSHFSITDAYTRAPTDPGRRSADHGRGQRQKVTFRIAAQYADELNMISTLVELPHKLEALHGHLDDHRPTRMTRCARAGSEPS